MKDSAVNGKIAFLLAVGGLGGLLYGVDFGVIAAAEPYLKAMGEAKDVQACVTVTGEIDLHGPNGGVTNDEGGIRPAMWIRKY